MSKISIFRIILASLSIIGWAVAVYALLVFGEARPEREIGTFIEQLPSRTTWDPQETELLLQLIWTCGFISLLSLAVNYYAAQHSKMGYWFNIPLLLLITLVAGLYVAIVA